jgi:hypothetical protein
MNIIVPWKMNFTLSDFNTIEIVLLVSSMLYEDIYINASSNMTTGCCKDLILYPPLVYSTYMLCCRLCCYNILIFLYIYYGSDPSQHFTQNVCGIHKLIKLFANNHFVRNGTCRQVVSNYRST